MEMSAAAHGGHPGQRRWSHRCANASGAEVAQSAFRVVFYHVSRGEAGEPEHADGVAGVPAAFGPLAMHRDPG
jgi:hypothetical protein